MIKNMSKLEHTVIAVNLAMLGILVMLRLFTDFSLYFFAGNPSIISIPVMLVSYGLGYIAPRFPIIAFFKWQQERDKWQRELIFTFSPFLVIMGVLVFLFALLASSYVIYYGLFMFNFFIAYYIQVNKNGFNF